MYIINDTYFQTPKREIPNLDEADSKSYAELERLIDEKCRLFLLDFLTIVEVAEFESYLVDGMFPTVTTGIPQKWINLVNGVTYIVNGISLKWSGLITLKGTYKGSILADYVYYHWLVDNVSYMTGVGDSKGQPKGANLVDPTQRIVNVWNEFVKGYQSDCIGNYYYGIIDYGFVYNVYGYTGESSLMQFLNDKPLDYISKSKNYFEPKNQLGL